MKQIKVIKYLTDLLDTPDSMQGEGGKALIVSTDGRTIEFGPAGSSLPSGVEGQTLRHDRGGWVASDDISNTNIEVQIIKDNASQFAKTTWEEYQAITMVGLYDNSENSVIASNPSSVTLDSTAALGEGVLTVGGNLGDPTAGFYPGVLIYSATADESNYIALAVKPTTIVAEEYPISKITEPQSLTTKEYVDTNTIAIHTTNYSVQPGDNISMFDCSSSDVTVTLPDAATVEGILFRIKVLTTASGTYKLTMDTNGGSIDGAASIDLTVDYEVITVVSDGTNYYKI